MERTFTFLKHHRPMTGQRCQRGRQKTKGIAVATVKASACEHSRRRVGAWMRAGSEINFATTMGLLTRCNPLMRLFLGPHQLGVFHFSVF
ncbi:MAG: hypothetical protein EBR47_05080 [Betaproteobacteria bacterium]|nr:hypothetical protein [Betaproteobacteria bacterium]